MLPELFLFLSTSAVFASAANANPSPYHQSHPLPWPSPSMQGKFRKAAVVSDHGICSEIGRKVLMSGGNAVDATIASLICVGVTNPQSSGIGGGFFMTIYNASTGTCTNINSRETAPMAANEKIYQDDPKASVSGYKSIAVPGEIKGFWKAYKEFGSGRVPWGELIWPTVDLCNDGIPVSEYLASILRTKDINETSQDSQFRKTFTNPSTGEYFKKGDIMKRPKLGATLHKLAESKDPVQLFYHGEIAQTIAKEMESYGGLITADDLAKFESLVMPSMKANLMGELDMCAHLRLQAALYNGHGKRDDLNTADFYHNLLEAEKFGYALRSTLGDPKFAKGMDDLVKNITSAEYPKYIASKINKDKVLTRDEYGFKFAKPDSGTSHVSVIDEMGNAVACTSTINLWLGSRVVSPGLGILWNDDIDDFLITGQVNQFGFEASENNILKPGKIPVSSMSPTVVFNTTDKKVRMVVGTTGGNKIIQGVAADFPNAIREDLQKRGHNIQVEHGMHSTTHAIVVDNTDGYIYANSDKRSHVHMHPDGY